MFLPILFFVTVASTLDTSTPRPRATVSCDLVPLTDCSKTCDGGWQIMKYACPEDGVVNCGCPPRTIYYQCNNRPCLKPNATLLEQFYDAEDQNAEESDYEYYEDDDDINIQANL